MGKKQETLELVGIEKELGEDALDKLSQMPLADFLHISLKKLEKGGAAECEMELELSRHGNPNGTVQGGSLSTLADITTSFAVVALGAETCTVSGKLDMLRGKTPEGVLTCRAEVCKAGGSLVWTDLWIRDERGSLIAKGEYLNFRLAVPTPE